MRKMARWDVAVDCQMLIHTNTHTRTYKHKEEKEEKEDRRKEEVFKNMHLYFTAFYHGAM